MLGPYGSTILIFVTQPLLPLEEVCPKVPLVSLPHQLIAAYYPAALGKWPPGAEVNIRPLSEAKFRGVLRGSRHCTAP